MRSAVVRMFVVVLIVLTLLSCSIYIVHDEVKDKAFELDLSWVGEGKNCGGGLTGNRKVAGSIPGLLLAVSVEVSLSETPSPS